MQSTLVIARSFTGEPLRRVALHTRKGLVFIASEAALGRVESGEMPSIGFPIEDVFEFDDDRFDGLRRRWQERGRVEPDDWTGLRPYRPIPASRG
jgi:hypothetical protein